MSTQETSTSTPARPNLALYKPVLASSFRSATEYAAQAVDGNLQSQWASAPQSLQWLWVDLLGVYEVAAVAISWGEESEAVLQASLNGLEWKDVSDVATGSDSTDFNPPIEAQWLRVVCQESCSVRELVVFGDRPRLNLALWRPTLASSHAGFEHVSRIVDGLEETQWISGSESQPWAWVDLLGLYTISEIEVLWGVAYAAHYELQTSRSGVDWATAATEAGAEGSRVRTKLPAGTQAQWVRVLCVSLAGFQCGIQELQVFEAVKPVPGSPSSENLAQGKPVLASSELLPHVATKAVDGLSDTYWASAASGNQWIRLDLLGHYVLSHAVLLWGPSSSAWPVSYDLEISFNGLTWEALVADILPEAQVQTVLPAVTTQWLRVYCRSEHGCGMQELQVYGTPALRRLALRHISVTSQPKKGAFLVRLALGLALVLAVLTMSGCVWCLQGKESKIQLRQQRLDAQ
ncbi:ACF2, partial [Symbiodinium necroappetens]